MVCSEFFKLLDNYENLTEVELLDLDRHSVECESCCKEYEFFKSITATVSALPCPEPPADLIAKVNKQIDELPLVSGRFNILNSIKNNSYRYATIAACLVVGLVVGLNNKSISERLTEKDNDGVISTTTIIETATYEPVAEPIEAVASVPEPEPTPAVTVEKKKQQPVKAEKKTTKKSAVIPKKATEKKVTVSTPSPTVIPQPEVIATSEPELPASVDYAETTPVIEKDTKGKYTIARGVYYIPEATEQPIVTEEPEAVENYSLAAGEYEIAIGYYDIPEKSIKKPRTEEFSEQLIVSVNNVVEVTAHMSELGAINSGHGYQMEIADFYELLSVLDSEGISYRYSSGATTSDVIIFSIVTY